MNKLTLPKMLDRQQCQICGRVDVVHQCSICKVSCCGACLDDHHEFDHNDDDDSEEEE